MRPLAAPSLATFGLLFGATVWGVIWYPYRLLQEAGISGVVSSLYTYAMALLLYTLLRRRLPHIPLRAAGLALAAGWTNLAYVLAVIDGEVVRVTLLFYLSPLWTVLLARFLLHEHPGRAGILVLILSLCGALVMLWQPATGLPLPMNHAEWLGLSAGAGFALTNVLTRRATDLGLEQKSVAVWLGVLFTGCLMLPFEAAMPSPLSLGAANLALMSVIGVALMLATLLVQYGITHMPVTRASVIFLFELVVVALTGWLLAHEVPTLRVWMGGALIVLSTLFAARIRS